MTNGWTAGLVHVTRSACLLSVLGVAIAARSAAQDRRLLLVTDGSATTVSGRLGTIDDEEILSVVPGRDVEVTGWLGDRNWPVLLGDQDRNGRLDDVPSEIDALEASNASVSDPTAFDLWLSLRSDRLFIDGTRVRDGDVFSLVPGGGARIEVSEDDFRRWIATGDDVDVDALALLSDGSIAFSLDEPVASSDAAIVSRNGGSAVVDDEAIFVHRLGEARAELHRSGPEVVALVNRVLGTTYQSVLNVQGLAEDPLEVGSLLFTTGIFQGAGATQVFTTARGGSLGRLNGAPLDASAFGFADSEDLGDVTVLAPSLAETPLSLDVAESEPSRSGDGLALFHVLGRPSERIRILVGHGATPLPNPVLVPGLGGAGYLFLDPSDVLVQRTASRPRLAFVLDAIGARDIALPLTGRAPNGTLLLFQVFSQDRAAASFPVAIRILP